MKFVNLRTWIAAAAALSIAAGCSRGDINRVQPNALSQLLGV